MVGVPGLFWLTAGLALLGSLLLTQIPEMPKTRGYYEKTGQQIQALLKDRALLPLHAAVFIQHLIFTASFVALPLVLQERFHWPQQEQSLVYLLAMLLPFVFLFPC